MRQLWLKPSALEVEGYGLLTEIDVKDTFNKKLNVDFPILLKS